MRKSSGRLEKVVRAFRGKKRKRKLVSVTDKEITLQSGDLKKGEEGEHTSGPRLATFHPLLKQFSQRELLNFIKEGGGGPELVRRGETRGSGAPRAGKVLYLWKGKKSLLGADRGRPLESFLEETSYSPGKKTETSVGGGGGPFKNRPTGGKGKSEVYER